MELSSVSSQCNFSKSLVRWGWKQQLLRGGGGIGGVLYTKCLRGVREEAGKAGWAGKPKGVGGGCRALLAGGPSRDRS